MTVPRGYGSPIEDGAARAQITKLTAALDSLIYTEHQHQGAVLIGEHHIRFNYGARRMVGLTMTEFQRGAVTAADPTGCRWTRAAGDPVPGKDHPSLAFHQKTAAGKLRGMAADLDVLIECADAGELIHVDDLHEAINPDTLRELADEIEGKE